MARAAHPPRRGDAGVTLIELLVVLVVVGVLAGAAALTVGQPGQRRDAAQEAALLAARLDIAAERAVIDGRTARMDWREDGYAFAQWDGSDWRPHAVQALADHHVLANGVILRRDPGARAGAFRITSALDGGGEDAAVFELATEGGTLEVRFDGFSASAETLP